MLLLCIKNLKENHIFLRFGKNKIKHCLLELILSPMGWMGCALKAQHSFLHTKVESETLKSHGSFCIRSFCGLVVFSQNCSYTVDLYLLITNTGPSVCSFYGIVKQLEKLTGLNDAYKHGICHLCRIKRNAVITCIKFNKSQHENTVE